MITEKSEGKIKWEVSYPIHTFQTIFVEKCSLDAPCEYISLNFLVLNKPPTPRKF